MAELAADNEMLASQLQEALAEGRMIYQSIADLEQRGSPGGVSSSNASSATSPMKVSDLNQEEQARFQVFICARSFDVSIVSSERTSSR